MVHAMQVDMDGESSENTTHSAVMSFMPVNCSPHFDAEAGGWGTPLQTSSEAGEQPSTDTSAYPNFEESSAPLRSPILKVGQSASGDYSTPQTVDSGEAADFLKFVKETPPEGSASGGTCKMEEISPATHSSEGSTEFAVKRGSINVTVRLRPRARGAGPATCCRLHKANNMVEYIPPPPEPSALRAPGLAMPSPFTGMHGSPLNCSQPQVEEDRSVFFTFDTVIGDDTPQAEVMSRIGRPILQHVLDGFNGTILCYGQSGSGKTHTMIGPEGGLPEHFLDSDEAGILPRFVRELFSRLNCYAKRARQQQQDIVEEQSMNSQGTPIDGHRDGEGTQARADSNGSKPQCARGPNYVVEMSALEIYKEDMCDLLQNFDCIPRTPLNARESTDSNYSFEQPAGRRRGYSQPCHGTGLHNKHPHRVPQRGANAPLRIREIAGAGVVVEGLSWHTVRDAAEGMRMLKYVTRQRHIESTAINKRSGRSHLFFFIAVKQRPTYGDTTDPYSAQSSWDSAARLWESHSLATLVDLAGSERVAHTKAKGERLEEARHINLSLTLLGNVIRKLTSNERKERTHIPYRDSKLTRLLQESIGGNAVTVLLCTVSPDLCDAAETLSTLHFANCAKRVHNRPVLRQVETRAGLINKLKQLTARNAWLEKQLEAIVNRVHTPTISATLCSHDQSLNMDTETAIIDVDSSSPTKISHVECCEGPHESIQQDSRCTSPSVSLCQIVPHFYFPHGKSASEPTVNDGGNRHQWAVSNLRCDSFLVGATVNSEGSSSSNRRSHKVPVFRSFEYTFWAALTQIVRMCLPSLRFPPAPVEEVFVPVFDCPACLRSASRSRSRHVSRVGVLES
uniref:Putative kinesin n=1 Tax=Trypanosoma congolense (strain IL3000) TaxID=1068625 RepID=G0UQV6_TRYCI|nr:putative kinesin [Trypanosoma congolense IL3000]